jgi:monomeric isocitrate dehydrogenase
MHFALLQYVLIKPLTPSIDSLGEYLATAVAFDHLGDITGNKKAALLAKTLNRLLGAF